MGNVDLILNILQWGVFFFFVIVNILIGFKRGFKKTFYYTLVSIGLTILIFFIISFVSITWIFSSVGRLVYFVESYVDIPENIKNILINPDLSPFLFAILDIVFKAVVFIVLYTPLKALLTRVVFRRIYETFLERKKKPIKTPSRFGGALVGAFRGVFVTIVLLLPIIVISGAFNSYDSELYEQVSKNNLKIESTTNNQDDELDDLETLLKVVQSFSKEGIGSFSNRLKFKKDGKSFDKFLFDLVYQTKIEDKNGNKETIYLSEELEHYGFIAQLLIEEGYLKENFDYKKINYEDNYKHIDQVLESLGESRFINILIPFAADIANDEGVFEEMLGFNPKTNIHTKKAYESIYDFNFEDETKHINESIKQLLLIGSVEELIELFENPELILELTQEERQKIGAVIKEVSNLDLLKLSNILVEYIITNDEFLENFDFVNNPNEYIHEQLEFIFDDINLISKEISNIGEIITNVFKDEYEDFDYKSFADGNNINYETFLKEEASNIVSEVIKGIANSKTTIEGIPLLVDYFVYNSDNDLITELANELSELSRDQDFKHEIENTNDIYSLIVTLGLESLFDGDQEKIDAIDSILEKDNNFTTIMEIVNHLFVDSKAVNDVLDLASEPLINNYIEDEDIKAVLLANISNEDFHIGLEVANLVNALEVFYKISNIREVKTHIDSKEYVELITKLGSLTDLEFDLLSSSLLSLQTFEYAPNEIINLVNSKLPNIQIDKPSSLDGTSLKADLKLALGITHELSKSFHLQNATSDNYKDLNLARGINYNKLNELLTFDLENHENSILLINAFNQLTNLNISFGNLGEFELPENLNKNNIDENWINEFNLLTEGLINVLKDFSSENETFKISINNINSIKSLNDIPLNRVLEYEDEQRAINTFSKLLNSNILDYNAKNVLKETIKSQNILNSLYSNNLDNVLDGEVYSKTISMLAMLVDKATDEDNLSLNDVRHILNVKTGIDVFNSLNDNELKRVSYNEILNTIFKDALVNEEVHEKVYDEINKLKLPNELKGINSGIFEYNYSLDSNGNILDNTLNDLLIFVRDLNLPNNIDKLNNNDLVNLLLDKVDADRVSDLLDINLIHELISNTILLDEVYTLGKNNYNKLNTYLESKEIYLDTNYDNVYETIKHNITNNNNLVSKDELMLYYKSFDALYQTGYKLNEITSNDYNKLANALTITNNENRNSLSYLSETRLLRNSVDQIINDEGLLEDLANLLNRRVVIGNNLVFRGDKLLDLDANSFKLPEYFFDNIGLKEEYLYEVLIMVAHQDLNIINRGKYTLNDLANLIKDDKTKLSYIYDSEIVRFSLNRFITSDSVSNSIVKIVNDLIEPLNNKYNTNVEISKDDFNLSYNLIDYEQAHSIISLVTNLNINNIKDLANIKSIDDFGKVLRLNETDELTLDLTSLKLVEEVLTTVLNSDKLSESIYNEVVKKVGSDINVNKDSFKLPKEYQTPEDYKDLIVALYGSNIDVNTKFTLNEVVNLLTKNKVVKNNDDEAINHILNSNIIYHILDQGLNAKEHDKVNELYIKFVNRELRKLNIDTINKEDELFIFRDSAYTNGKISKDAIKELLYSTKALNLEGKFSLNTLYSTIGRNEVNGIDDFDRLYDSIILKSLLSNALLSEKALNYASNMINDKAKKKLVNEDILKMPNEVIDNDNLLKSEDIKSLISALSILNVENITLEGVLNIEGNNYYNGKDDLDRVLDSIIIHTYIDRVTKSSLTDNLVKEELSKILNKDIKDFIVTPEDNHLDNDNKLSKDEIRKMFVSAKLLDFKNISLKTVINLANNEDELDEFLNSNYITTLISRVFTLDETKEVLAEAGKFNKDDLTLEYVSKDSNNNLTKKEVKDLFIGLAILDISDFSSITNENLKALSDDDMDILLNSNYLHQVIDLTLKAQLDEDDITENVIDSNGLIKKSEIKALVELLKILDIEDPSDLNGDNIKTSTLDEAINLNSMLINKLISNVVIDTIDVPKDSVDSTNTIYLNELNNLIEAINIINNYEDKALSNINMKNINVKSNMIDSLVNIDNGNSHIVRRLLSEGIINTLDNDLLINLLENDNKDIKKEELNNLNESLKKLEIDDLSNLENEDFNNLELSKLNDSFNQNSEIVRRLISNSIKDEDIFVVSNDVLDSNNYIEKEELTNLLNAANNIEDVNTITDLVDLINEIETNPLAATKITDSYDENNKSQILEDTVTKMLEDFWS